MKNGFYLSQGFLSIAWVYCLTWQRHLNDIGGITRHDAWKRGTGRVITFLNVFSILTVNYKGLRSALRAGTLLGAALCWSSLLLARSAGSLSDGGVAHHNKELNSQTTAEVSPTPIFYSVFIFFLKIPLNISNGLTQRKSQIMRESAVFGRSRPLLSAPRATASDFSQTTTFAFWNYRLQDFYEWLHHGVPGFFFFFLLQQCVRFNCVQTLYAKVLNV